jgi:predicted DNA-binding transcriptional regulator YafY
VGFDDERWLVQFIANLPWDVAVVEPEGLRESLAALGRRLVAAHERAPWLTPG